MGVAGCLGVDKLTSAEEIGAAVDFSSMQNCGVTGYQKMYQLIVKPRCFACHGTGQEPPIASRKFSIAHQAARENDSKLLDQASNSHGGCSACNLTPDDPLYEDLAQWVMQETCEPSGESGVSDGGATVAAAKAKPVGLPSPLIAGDYTIDLARLSSGYVGAEIRFRLAKLGGGWIVDQFSTTQPPVNVILTAPTLRIGLDRRNLVTGELAISTGGISDPDIDGTALAWLSGTEPLVFEVSNIRSLAASEGDGARAVYAQSADRKRSSAESLAYFTTTVRPAFQAETCANCHGAGDPVMSHADALMMLSNGTGPANNRLFNKPRQVNGVQHSGGRRCALDSTPPCNVIMNWWNYEFE